MSTTTPRTGQDAHTPTAERRWYVGKGIRHADTAGICVQWIDGEPIEETIAEVLPSCDGNQTRDKQAAFIARACNSHADLVAALEEIDRICTESPAACRRRMGTRIGNASVVARAALAKAHR